MTGNFNQETKNNLSFGQSRSSFTLIEPFDKLRASSRQSFTLIELLVVLALVAILSVVVIVTLNPAELLKQARDSNRLSDLATINTALNLFSTDVIGGFMGTSTVVYVSLPDNSSSTCGFWGLPALPTGYTYNCVTSQNLRNTDGSGWIPVNFNRISSNSPISQLPIDPINTTSTGSYYTYMTGGSWHLASNMESTKQKSVTGASGTDGGISLSSYEIGNNLRLIPSGLLEWKRDSSLVGYWTFDEGSGATVYDWSGSGLNLTWSGTGSRYTTAKTGTYAGIFNGVNDSAYNSAGFNIPGSFTFSGWIYSSSVSGIDTIMNIGGWSAGSSAYISIYFSANANNIFYQYANGVNTSAYSGVVWNANTWKYVTVVHDHSASRISIYLDGIYLTSAVSVANHLSISGLWGAFGSYAWSPTGDSFNGYLDDFRLYNRALSAAEILALYNAAR